MNVSQRPASQLTTTSMLVRSAPRHCWTSAMLTSHIWQSERAWQLVSFCAVYRGRAPTALRGKSGIRSEERRVGKEGRRWRRLGQRQNNPERAAGFRAEERRAEKQEGR